MGGSGTALCIICVVCELASLDASDTVAGWSQIGSECKAALNYIVDLHSKQRKEVWTKHAAERAKLRRSIAKHAGKHGFDDIFASADARRELPRVGDIATEDDARRQAIREASAKWLKAEKFGLLTAFRQQVQRVQTEWSDHVGQLCSVSASVCYRSTA